MHTPLKTVRVIISSTSRDMHADRDYLKQESNALQERVFPRLRELCQQHGARFPGNRPALGIDPA